MTEGAAAGRLTIELDPRPGALTGWLTGPSGECRRFDGWLEFVSMISEIADGEVRLGPDS